MDLATQSPWINTVVRFHGAWHVSDSGSLRTTMCYSSAGVDNASINRGADPRAIHLGDDDPRFAGMLHGYQPLAKARWSFRSLINPLENSETRRAVLCLASRRPVQDLEERGR